MGGGITGQLLATNPERFITAHFGGSGIMETDPDWIAKLPPDKQGRDPQEDVVAKGLRINHAMDNGMSRAEAEKLAETPPPPRPTPVAGAPRPAAPQIDLSKLNIPIIIINGELDRPRAKSMRAAREANQVEIVVLPGKSHLTAIAAGYMPKEYVTNLAGFIDSHDQN
jgi:pimeloyl-ACP methyl ester carboxylesterase